MTKIRLPYDGQRVRLAKSFSLDSRTKQSFKDECDLNQIIERYARTGVLDHMSSTTPKYIDCTTVSDYQTAMTAITEAQDQFAALPARVRRFFDNDPEQFLAAFENPDMRDDLLDLGLIEAPPAQSDPQDPPVSEAPPAAQGAQNES